MAFRGIHKGFCYVKKQKGDEEMLLQMSTIAPIAPIAEGAAASDKPWIYLCTVLVLLFVVATIMVVKYLMKLDQQHREESKAREAALMQHLERSNESQERTALAVEGINSNLSTLGGRVDRIEKHIYKKEC